jgi:hypothetical protein
MFGFSFEWRSVKIWYYGILEIDVDNCWDICRTEIPMGTMSGTQVQEP